MGYALGVDVGAVSTVAAVARWAGDWGGVEGADLGTGAVVLGNESAAAPTAVCVSGDGEVLVGAAAVQRGGAHVVRLERGALAHLGDDAAAQTSLLPAHDVVALVTRWVVDAAAAQEGGAAEVVVLTHPASWGQRGQELVRSALAALGLPAVVLVPAAVAAAVRATTSGPVTAGSTVAVHDLGAAAFDAAVVSTHAGAGPAVVRSAAGFERAEGAVLDDALVARTVEVLAGAVTAVGLAPGGLACVLLVGAEAHQPRLAPALSEAFGRPVVVDADPVLTAALGAAQLGSSLAAAGTGPVAPVARAAVGAGGVGGGVGARTGAGGGGALPAAAPRAAAWSGLLASGASAALRRQRTGRGPRGPRGGHRSRRTGWVVAGACAALLLTGLSVRAASRHGDEAAGATTAVATAGAGTAGSGAASGAALGAGGATSAASGSSITGSTPTSLTGARAPSGARTRPASGPSTAVDDGSLASARVSPASSGPRASTGAGSGAAGGVLLPARTLSSAPGAGVLVTPSTRVPLTTPSAPTSSTAATATAAPPAGTASATTPTSSRPTTATTPTTAGTPGASATTGSTSTRGATSSGATASSTTSSSTTSTGTRTRRATTSRATASASASASGATAATSSAAG